MSVSTTDTRDTRKRKKSSITPQQLIELGKLPPQAVDLEEAVLGGLMMDKDVLSKVVGILKPDAFYKEAHQVIYSAIQTLYEQSNPVDILTVTQQLKRDAMLERAGGAFYVTQLTDRIASSANTEMHARIILEKFIQREVIRISTNLLQYAYEDSSDIFELLNTTEQSLFDISQTNIRKDYEHIRPVLGNSIQNMENVKNKKTGGVPSGFICLDTITGGFQDADLILVAARPGTGKTAFVVNVARNAAVQFKKPVAIFSLEMTSMQLGNRFIAAEAEITADTIRKGTLTDEEFQQMHGRIAELSTSPIYLDDTPALSVFEFRTKAKRLKANHDISMIIIDYLQLMVSGQKKFSREQEISYISGAVKAIAKELKIPIIALSQLSRAVEARGGAKRPQLSDLRESGALEQDADLVMFLYRPMLAGIMMDEMGNSTEGIVELIIAKHRNGRIDNVNLIFLDHLAKFIEPRETTPSYGNTNNASSSGTNIDDEF